MISDKVEGSIRGDLYTDGTQARHTGPIMEERWRVGYRMHREVLDEGKVDKLEEKSDVTFPLSEKKMRCSGPGLKSCMLSSVPVLSWLPQRQRHWRPDLRHQCGPHAPTTRCAI